MGGFAIILKGAPVDEGAVCGIFTAKGMIQSRIIETSRYRVLLYRKILIPEENDAVHGDVGIYPVGTMIYKFLSPRMSCLRLLEDILDNKVDYDAFCGHFVTIIQEGDRIQLLCDPLGQYNLFFSKDCSLISSSFLSVVYGLKSVTLNRWALIENLLGGIIIGSDTIFNEIKKATGNWPVELNGIKILRPRRNCEDVFSDKVNKHSQDEEVRRQLDILKEYFKNLEGWLNGRKVAIGMTGGHDSRLLLGMLLETGAIPVIHTHPRKIEDADLKAVRLICRSLGIEPIITEVIFTEDMDEKTTFETMKEAMVYKDGLVRLSHYWFQQYNTITYRRKVLGGADVAMDGIGGEQYRNEETFTGRLSMEDFIKYYIFPINIEVVFTNKIQINEFIDTLKTKLIHLLGIPSAGRIVDRQLFKRYQNEVFIPAGRGLNISCDNQLTYFLSPFADARVSLPAYRASDSLGLGLRFEQKMITRLNPGLAAIPSNDGFDFLKGEGWKRIIKRYGKVLVPRSIIYRRNSRILIGQSVEPYLGKLLNENRIIQESVDRVRKLKLPICFSMLLKREGTAQLVAGIGFLLLYLEAKINIDDQELD